MRLHLYLSPNERPVRFDYQHYLIGAFHKWLGANDLHDRLSLYSLSWLYEGRAHKGAIEFLRGAHWFLSVYEESLVELIVNNALRYPEVCCGMCVVRIEQQATPRFGPRHTFKVGSPVLAKSREVDGRIRHYVYSDPEADAALTATLRHKLDVAGLGAPHNAATVSFDKAYRNPKTKLVRIKEVANRASICPVTVEGTPEAVAFAWNVGIGNGTGSGFGSLL